MACGVFSAYSTKGDDVFPCIYWGGKAQNNRGQQSHGFLTHDGYDFRGPKKGLGLIPDQKSVEEWSKELRGNKGIASVRYTTFGSTDEESLMKGAQPVLLDNFGLVFNGQLLPAKKLDVEIRKTYKDFICPNCDLGYFAAIMNIEHNKGNDLVDDVRSCMTDVEGAYSVAGISKDGRFFAFRDPHGIRPLCFATDQEKGLHAVSSETVGFDINKITYGENFEVRPGELIIFNDKNIERQQVVSPQGDALCAFEFAYFARPDSKMPKTRRYVYEMREEFGRNLVENNPDILENADMIISAPETADDCALGMERASYLRWERSTRRHRYVTERAFMALAGERKNTIEKKINILPEKVAGKRVIVAEDSIVRGDTTEIFVKDLRSYGARKVYVFSTFPRITNPCPYGIDMATHSELIGASRNEEEVAQKIGADAVRYQSLESLKKTIGLGDNLCTGCLTGKYPTPCAQRIVDRSKELFEKGIKIKGRIIDELRE